MTRPFVIWVTVVLSVLLGVSAAFGLLKVILQVPMGLGPNSAIPVWRVLLMVAIQAVATMFLAAVVYAAFARPRWGRAVCAVFAVLLALMVLYAGFHPDPHPLFAIKSGAEEAGAVVGRLMMCVLFGVYAYKMVIGTKVRAYFLSTEGRK
ncbi:hypothetical protein DEO45_14235 [Rhodanobacter denitrificans]|uniref:DUF2569 family protein n=1 Tax=Rhodanobacter denitrificans TaxID=666685 RepID=A0A368KCM7_9GAMM|nr:hypothetical protein [Rhodanobacter denitrificans]RCS28856.1 hypothetical protein DEO45_14235 [Rhodanobacter denitrificans]